MKDLMHVPIFIGDGKLSYENRPTPKIKNDDDVLLQVEASGICGTDLNILAVPAAHKAKTGIVIGHEGVARVAEIGLKVGGLKVGDRVVIAPRLTCGNCDYCRRGLDNQCTNYQTIGTTLDGTFAPYAVAPERALYKVSDAVSMEDAALFEPLSCVVGAFAKAPVKPGDNVCVIGAGPMGALFAMVAHAHGAGKVFMADIVPYRLDFAQEVLGAIPINSKTQDLKQVVMDATGIGCDTVIDAVGNQLGSAINLARRAGTVILFGLRPNDTQQVSQYHITRYDLNVMGAFVGLNPFVQTINLLESGRINPSQLITHKLPLSELMQGVDLMRSGQAMKVLIRTDDTTQPMTNNLRMNTSHHDLLARIASLYYDEEKSQDAIGKELGLSRVKVYRLLKEAKEVGVVQVLIHWPIERNAELEQALQQRFGLKDALVLNANGNAPADALREVGKLGAQYLERVLRDDCTLAICLGRSTYEVVNAMRPRHQSHIRVAQAVGSIPFSMQAFDSATIGRQLAQKLGGEVLYLSSPMMADTPKSAGVIRRQPHVHATLDAARHADVALVGIGNLDPQKSRLVEAGFLSSDDMRVLSKQDAVGDMAGQIFSADGKTHGSPHNKRIIGITLDELAKIPTSIAVAAGSDKAQAILGGLRTHAINVLCTDTLTAQAILQMTNDK